MTTIQKLASRIRQIVVNSKELEDTVIFGLPPRVQRQMPGILLFTTFTLI